MLLLLLIAILSSAKIASASSAALDDYQYAPPPVDSNVTGMHLPSQGHRKLAAYTLTFIYKGTVQAWLVPTGVDTFMVDAYGAAGGNDH